MATRRIGESQALSDEFSKLRVSLAECAKPIERNMLLTLLGRKRAAFNMPEQTPEMWIALWEPYVEVLSGMSLEAIEKAFFRWNSAEMYPKEPGRHAFFPKPAELCWLSKDHQTKLQMAAYRAKMAAEKAASDVEWTPERKAEERRKAIEMGTLTPDGRFPKIALPTFAPPPKPMTPAQVAELNRMAAQGPDEEIEAL